MKKIIFALAFIIQACTSTTATLSASRMGCSPNEIEISNEDVGMMTRSWTAKCRGKTYYCFKDASGYTVDIQCTEDETKPSEEGSSPQNSSLDVRLKKLKKLRNEGLISDSEYQEKRQKILDEI